MTQQQLSQYLKTDRLADQWWVAVDDTVLDNPMTIAQIVEVAEEMPEAEVLVLHSSRANEKEPHWEPYTRPPANRAPAVAEPVKGTGAVPSGASGETKAPFERDRDPAKRLRILESRIEFLQNTVDAMLNMLRELEGFETLRKTLEERAEFIHRSEEELINRTYAFEEKVAELEQRIDDNDR